MIRVHSRQQLNTIRRKVWDILRTHDSVTVSEAYKPYPEREQNSVDHLSPISASLRHLYLKGMARREKVQ